MTRFKVLYCPWYISLSVCLLTCSFISVLYVKREGWSSELESTLAWELGGVGSRLSGLNMILRLVCWGKSRGRLSVQGASRVCPCERGVRRELKEGRSGMLPRGAVTGLRSDCIWKRKEEDIKGDWTSKVWAKIPKIATLYRNCNKVMFRGRVAGKGEQVLS